MVSLFFFIEITWIVIHFHNSSPLYGSIFENAEVLAVIVELRKEIVIENLRFYAQRCQNAFGFYLASASQTVVQQADELQVGQTRCYVGRLIEIAQEIPIQIQSFHPLITFRPALQLQHRETVEGEIEISDATYDFPIEFTDMIP